MVSLHELPYDYDLDVQAGLYPDAVAPRRRRRKEPEVTLEARRRITEKRIKDLEEELATLYELTDDDFPEGSVIWFEKMYAVGHQVPEGPFGEGYTYAFLKANGRWYSTGRENPRKWEEVLKFLSSGVRQVWFATEWEDVSDVIPKGEL